jgi:hypothetical protein
MNALRASLKRNSHWALLAVCSVLSATSTWFSQSQLSDWTSEIDQLRPVNVPTKKIPPADLEALEKAASSLQTPAKWDPDLSTSLFVSERYLLEGGVLRKPENASFYRHSDGRPIENSWFAQYPALAKLLGKPKLQSEDTDEDGFTNEEEWAAKTDPTDRKSHPPLFSKLYLVSQTEVSHKFKLINVSNLGTPAQTATIERIGEPLPDWLANSKKASDEAKKLQFRRPILKPNQFMGEITLTREEGNQKTEVSIGEPNLQLVSIDQVTVDKVPIVRIKLRDRESGRERFAYKPLGTNDSRDKRLVQEADFEEKNIQLAYRHRLGGKDIQTAPGQTFELSAPNGTTEVYKVKDSTQNTVTLINVRDGKEIEIPTEPTRTGAASLNNP